MSKSNPTKLLDKAFNDAVQEAAALDRQGIVQDDTYDLFAGNPPSNVELVKACRDFYHREQIVMDTAIKGALQFLESPHGVAQVKALEASFENQDPNAFSTQLASEILDSDEFSPVLSSNRSRGLQGFGIGVSAGASAFAGVLAGADIVFDFQNKAEVHPRTWVGGSIKSGLSVSAGLELSFWVNKPVTGLIRGWLLDLYIPEFVVGYFIRLMYIKEREQGTTDFTPSGMSIQFPLGIGFPLRKKKEKDPTLVALFAARQKAWDRSKRATLDVVNKATGVNTIAVREIATLTATLKNTSGNTIALSTEASMTVGMPTYFSESDVGNMSINYPGWTATNDGGKLTLTPSQAYTWSAGASIVFDITNVKSSSQPKGGQQSFPGTVNLTVKDPSFSTPIVNAVEFDLVWENSEADLKWQVNLNSGTFQLDSGQSGSGNIEAYAQPGNQFELLTTVVNTSSGDKWDLGYIYNYNTLVENQVIPQVCAVWWKQGTLQVGKNIFYGNIVSESGDTSTCYYAGLSSTKDSIAITATFGASDVSAHEAAA